MSDFILLGVLRMDMPHDDDPAGRTQYEQRAREAADRIECLQRRVTDLEMAIVNYRHDAVVPMANIINNMNIGENSPLRRSLIKWREEDEKIRDILTHPDEKKGRS